VEFTVGRATGKQVTGRTLRSGIESAAVSERRNTTCLLFGISVFLE